MSDNREQRIRERAYQKWEQEGRSHGNDTRHWAEAEREIEQETDFVPSLVPQGNLLSTPKTRKAGAMTAGKAGSEKKARQARASTPGTDPGAP